IGIAEELGARTLRSMVQAHEISAGPAAVVEELRAVLPLLDAAAVTLALETYEQIPTSTLIEVIEAVDSPSVRLCLDPANCVPSLEHPREVVESCAPHTATLHVKDFGFTRREGWWASPIPARRWARASSTSTTSSRPSMRRAARPARSSSTGCRGRGRSAPPLLPSATGPTAR